VNRLIFDFDDAVWLRDSYSPRGFHSPRRLARFRATVRAADAVVAGNRYLLEQAGRFAPADGLTLVPTCVDPARYPAATREEAAGVRLVWVGSSSTLRGLEAARPLLEEVGRRNPGATLKIVCDRFVEFDHLPVIRCPWSEPAEAGELASADVGISWVPDDPWSRGKCGLKVLQYLAAGLPVVANPVGVHVEMVRPGRNGFLAATPDEWAGAVRRLADDSALRRRMGAAGRGSVGAEYGVGAGARRWLELLERWKGNRRCA
jgi:glycosyltransferase involved in cell wall biosynthesis